MMTHPALPLTKIGFIGLGIMGRSMALNLRKAGFELTVWNRTAEKCAPLIAAGAKQAHSPRALAESDVQVVCLNVTDSADVESVLFGEQGIAQSTSFSDRHSIVIDFSTISPQATIEFAQRLAQQHITLLDSPVSGGDIGAQNGTLTLMVGGPAAAFDFCQPIFSAVGKTITHVGPSGMGQMCKACNQTLVAATLMGVCEAMTLAQRSGLDVNTMIKVVSAGAAGSWQLANLGPKIAQGDFAPGFMIDLILKDLAIVADNAQALNLKLEGLQAARHYFEQARAAGLGREGTQAMAKAVGFEPG